MKKLFAFLLLIICITNVKAYENEYFKIDIPEGYTEEINENIYKWTKNNNYISITISNNKDNYDINKYTDQDIENQKKYLEETYSKELKDYNIDVQVTSINKDKINNYDILSYTLFWPSHELTGYDIQQKGAVYTTKNYIYTITVSSDEEVKNEDFKKVLNTFILKDEEITYSSGLLGFIIVSGTILGIIGYIIEKKRA